MYNSNFNLLLNVYLFYTNVVSVNKSKVKPGYKLWNKSLMRNNLNIKIKRFEVYFS